MTVPLSACIPGYTVPVTIGGSSTFQLTLDTGSTTLAVASSACSDCGVSPEYSPGTTAVDLHQTATSTYAGGESWSGEIFEDTVSMGTPTASASVMFASIEMQSQFFNGAVRCGASSTSYAYQGIVGFAPGPDAVMGTDGFFDQFVSAHRVPNVFATELCDVGGTLWLGGFDPSVLTGPPQYTSLSGSFFDTAAYAVDLETVTVGKTAVPVPVASFPESIVDTGTSVFILQSAAFDAVTSALARDPGFKKVFGRMASTFFSAGNCVSLPQTKDELDTTLPTMTMGFDKSAPFSVPATATESYLIPYSGYFCPALVSYASSGSFPLSAIIGSPMLRSSVVIFDRAGMRLGFAPRKPCP